MAQCREETRRGGRCTRRAVHGESRCASHLGRCGARPGNLNALKHGLYSKRLTPEEQADFALALEMEGIDQEVAIARILVLRCVKPPKRKTRDADGKVVETDGEPVPPEAAARVLEALAKVLKTQRVLSGEADDSLAGACGRILDEVGAELGIE